MHRLLLVALSAACAWPSAPLAAESIEAFDRARRRQGVWAALGATSGSLRLDAPTAKVGASVYGLPVVAMGVDLWPDEHLGVFAQGTFGLGSDLDYAERGVRLAYNVHQVALGARYRWHLGASTTALAPFVGAGLHLMHETTPDQIPSVLIRKTAAGPELTAGVEWPILGEALWLRAAGRVGLPFFVRESPDDSGDPTDFLALGARLEGTVALAGQWGATLVVDWHQQRLRFTGEGTRAASVFGAETTERLLTVTAGARYGF